MDQVLTTVAVMLGILAVMSAVVYYMIHKNKLANSGFTIDLKATRYLGRNERLVAFEYNGEDYLIAITGQAVVLLNKNNSQEPAGLETKVDSLSGESFSGDVARN